MHDLYYVSQWPTTAYDNTLVQHGKDAVNFRYKRRIFSGSPSYLFHKNLQLILIIYYFHSEPFSVASAEGKAQESFRIDSHVDLLWKGVLVSSEWY